MTSPRCARIGSGASRLPPMVAVRGSASAGFEGIDGVIATYFDAEGYIALVLQIQQLDMLGSRWSATTADPRTVIVETRIIDGHPAYVKYSPIDDRIHSTLVRIYNRATGVEYLVIGSDPSISGGNVDAAIEIARSLLPPPTTIRYDTFDTSGAVAEPGSYAFLADPADTTSAVTTYEATARRHDDGAADPQVRRLRRLAGRALRRRRGRRPLRVARGRRLLRALHGDRGQAQPGGPVHRKRSPSSG